MNWEKDGRSRRGRKMKSISMDDEVEENETPLQEEETGVVSRAQRKDYSHLHNKDLRIQVTGDFIIGIDAKGNAYILNEL